MKENYFSCEAKAIVCFSFFLSRKEPRDETTSNFGRKFESSPWKVLLFARVFTIERGRQRTYPKVNKKWVLHMCEKYVAIAERKHKYFNRVP